MNPRVAGNLEAIEFLSCDFVDPTNLDEFVVGEDRDTRDHVAALFVEILNPGALLERFLSLLPYFLPIDSVSANLRDGLNQLGALLLRNLKHLLLSIGQSIAETGSTEGCFVLDHDLVRKL